MIKTRWPLLLVAAAMLLNGAPLRAQSDDRRWDKVAEKVAAAAEKLATNAAKAAEKTARKLEKHFAHEFDDDDHEWTSRTEEIDTTFAFSRDGVIDLTSTSGDIVVTGWDRNEARIRATTERGRLNYSFSPSRITLELDTSRRPGDTHFELSVPQGARLIVRTSSGEIVVRGTNGRVSAVSTSGDIDLRDARGQIKLETLSGEIRGSGLNGEVEATSVSGSIEVTNVTGPVHLESTNGDVVLTDVRSSNVEASTVNGEVVYRGTIERNGNYEFHSHSGDVMLEIPGTSSARVSIETFNGNIDSEFPMTLEPTTNRTRSSPRRLEFAIAGGEARILVESFSGDINLRRQ